MNKATLWKIALAVAVVAAILFVIADRTDNQQQPAQSAVPVVCKPYFAATALFLRRDGNIEAMPSEAPNIRALARDHGCGAYLSRCSSHQSVAAKADCFDSLAQ